MSRITDPDLIADLHLEWKECVLCLAVYPTRLSLHHIHNKPRDDVRANLVLLCGDGVSGCHGLITVNDFAKCRELGIYLVKHRLDTMEYLGKKLGFLQATEWMRHQWHLDQVMAV